MELSATGWTDNGRFLRQGKSDVDLGYCEANLLHQGKRILGLAAKLKATSIDMTINSCHIKFIHQIES